MNKDCKSLLKSGLNIFIAVFRSVLAVVGLTPGGPRSSSAPPPGVTGQVTPRVTIPLTGEYQIMTSLKFSHGTRVRSLSGCPRANKPKSRHKDGAESEPLRWADIWHDGNTQYWTEHTAGAQYQAVMAPVMPRANFCLIGGELIIPRSFKPFSLIFKNFQSNAECLILSERACPIAAKMAKSLNSSSRSHYSYNQYPYPAMEQPPEYSGAGCPCPMGICL